MSTKEYTTQITAQILTDQVKAIDNLVASGCYTSRAQYIKQAVAMKMKSEYELASEFDISVLLDVVEAAGYNVER